MSSKQKKQAATGVRYTDAQKSEVINFVVQYNRANQRGGQSKAAEKFKVTPLTIATWLKSAGKPAAPAKTKTAAPAKTKTAAPAKAAPVKKAAPAKVKKASAKSKMGVRYSPEKKQEVVNFVTSYNASNGRGGQNQAVKKFGLSVLTVSAWLKAAGKKGAKGAAKPVVTKTAKPVKKAVVKAAKPVSELEALKAAIRKLIN
jgi:transposase-like protein